MDYTNELWPFMLKHYNKPNSISGPYEEYPNNLTLTASSFLFTAAGKAAAIPPRHGYLSHPPYAMYTIVPQTELHSQTHKALNQSNFQWSLLLTIVLARTTISNPRQNQISRPCYPMPNTTVSHGTIFFGARAGSSNYQNALATYSASSFYQTVFPNPFKTMLPYN